MASYTSFDFQNLTKVGSTYTVNFAETSDAIVWTELSSPNSTFEIGETYSESFGNATYLGQISVDGFLYHLFNQAGQNVLTAELDAAPGLTVGYTFDESELSIIQSALCFAPDTRIASPSGEIAVQDLEIGDLVLCADDRAVPVKWIGRQALNARFAIAERLEPVRIAAGALGNGLPHSDLTVSADHGMMLEGMVVNASALVNGTTISFVPLAELEDGFTYYHVETEHHDVIRANGAETETFVDVSGRQTFDNYAEYLDLYGVERIIPEMRAARITSQRLLPESLCALLGITETFDVFDLKTRTA